MCWSPRCAGLGAIWTENDFATTIRRPWGLRGPITHLSGPLEPTGIFLVYNQPPHIDLLVCLRLGCAWLGAIWREIDLAAAIWAPGGGLGGRGPIAHLSGLLEPTGIFLVYYQPPHMDQFLCPRPGCAWLGAFWTENDPRRSCGRFRGGCWG